MKALVVAYGSQVEVGRRLGYTQAAIGKAVTRAEVGFGLRDALLEHITISREDLLRRYGPRGPLAFVGDTRAKGFEGRTFALTEARKRGICDDALRMIVTDPAFNREGMRGQPPIFWSNKLDALHELVTGQPPPPRPLPPAAFDETTGKARPKRPQRVAPPSKRRGSASA